MKLISLSLLIIAVNASLPTMNSAAVYGDDWPQWRGPQRDGVWREDGWSIRFPSRACRSDGVPGFSTAGRDRPWPRVACIVTDHDYKSNPEVERVLCFDEATGKRLWLHEYPCPYGNMEYGNGPRATPTVHDGLVYTLGTMGHLACLDAADRCRRLEERSGRI